MKTVWKCEMCDWELTVDDVRKGGEEAFIHESENEGHITYLTRITEKK